MTQTKQEAEEENPRMIMEQKITGKLGKNIEKATERELYEALLSVVKEMAAERSDGT